MVRWSSVTSSERSALHPAALHQLVLSVQSSGERLRRPRVHVAAATAERGKRKKKSLVLAPSSITHNNKKKNQTNSGAYPAIPPRPMWLCPGRAPSLSGTDTKHKIKTPARAFDRPGKTCSEPTYSARVCPRPSSDPSPSLDLLPCRTRTTHHLSAKRWRGDGGGRTCRLGSVPTWDSCVCRSSRSSCPCRVCPPCLRSAAAQDEGRSVRRRSDADGAAGGRFFFTWPSLSPPIPRELSRRSIAMLSW